MPRSHQSAITACDGEQADGVGGSAGIVSRTGPEREPIFGQTFLVVGGAVIQWIQYCSLDTTADIQPLL